MRLALGLMLCALLNVGLAAQPIKEPRGYWNGDINAPVPSSLRGARVLSVTGTQALIAQGAAVIDVSNAPVKPAGLAANAPWMPLPHKALPGAHWIPGAGAASLTPEFDLFLRARLAAATHDEADVPLIVYCHRRCWLSWNAAKRALSFGYRQVYWFPDGIEGWLIAGKPTDTVQPELPPDRATEAAQAR